MEVNGVRVSGDQVCEGTERRMGMKVVVGVDDSKGSFYALRWALDNLFIPMASPESGGMLFLVHVQPNLFDYGYPVEPTGIVFDTTGETLESLEKARKKSSAAILSRALQMCKDKMVKAETMIMKGDAREMVCDAADQVHADLLVVGSRGLGPVSRALLGSVSDYCANHAKTPVLIVRPATDENDGDKW